MTALYGKAELVVYLLIINMMRCVFNLVHKLNLPFYLELFWNLIKQQTFPFWVENLNRSQFSINEFNYLYPVRWSNLSSVRLTNERVVLCRYNAWLLAVEGLLQGRGKEKPTAKTNGISFECCTWFHRSMNRIFPLFYASLRWDLSLVCVFEQFQALLSQTNIWFYENFHATKPPLTNFSW